MMKYKDTLCTNFIVKHKEHRPYGDKAEGKFIPSEKGRRAIFVPSFGTMEKEEVDYVVEVAQEQEDERLKRPWISPTKQRLEAITQIARNAPRGERKKAINEVLKEE